MHKIGEIFRRNPVKFAAIMGLSIDLLLLIAVLMVRENLAAEEMLGMIIVAFASLCFATILLFFKHLCIIEDRDTGERFLELRYKRWSLRV